MSEDPGTYTGGMMPLIECEPGGVRFTLTTQEGTMLFTWTMSHGQALDVGHLLVTSVNEWAQTCQE